MMIGLSFMLTPSCWSKSEIYMIRCNACSTASSVEATSASVCAAETNHVPREVGRTPLSSSADQEKRQFLLVGGGVRRVVMNRTAGEARMESRRQSADVQIGAVPTPSRSDPLHQRLAGRVDPLVGGRRRGQLTQRRQCRRKADEIGVVRTRVIDAAGGKHFHDVPASAKRRHRKSRPERLGEH